MNTLKSNKIFVAGVCGVVLLFGGILIGATLVSAADSSFKIKENKMFFTQIEANDSQYTLPSVTGKTGYVYILRGASGSLEVLPASGEKIDGDTASLINVRWVVLVGDEQNNTWWIISKFPQS